MDGSLITPRFYFSLDKDGCVINSSAPDKVDEIYKSLIKEVTQGISSKFGQKLHSLMVRGSISSGRAKPNISDADFVIAIKDMPSAADLLWLQGKSLLLMNKYPVVSLIDFTCNDIQSMLQSPQLFFLRINLKVNSFCLCGDNPIPLLPEVRPGNDLSVQILHHATNEILNLSSKLKKSSGELMYQGTHKPVSFWCIWIMRVLLRSSIAFVMRSKPIYSNDVSTCSYEFMKMFPQYSTYIEKAFTWERLPTNSLDDLNIYLEEFLPIYLNMASDAVR